MATKEEIETLMNKSEPLTVAEITILNAEADGLKSKNNQDVNSLKNLRKKDGLTQAEHDEVDRIRHKIGPELKFAARMDRKTGRPVESVG
jgi:hypothetical protein